jgi:GT2 family glycosyltransferase
MYVEDLDLSLRLWLQGKAVGVTPGALVIHDYSFDKGHHKWFLLERNRLRTVLSVYPGGLLALITPALIAFEVALLAVAARGGWLSAKVQADLAILRDSTRIIRRRRQVQATRRVSSATFAALLTASLDNPYVAEAASVPVLAAGQGLYWRVVERVLRW